MQRVGTDERAIGHQLGQALVRPLSTVLDVVENGVGQVTALRSREKDVGLVRIEEIIKPLHFEGR